MPATYSIRFHASGFWLCLLLVLSIFLVISPVLSSSLPFPKSSSLPSPPPSSSPWSSPDSSLLAPYTPFSPHLRSSDIHVSPLVLVSTINGDLHALNRVTGEKLWTVQGEGSMVGSERPRRRRSKYQRNPEQVESNERFLVDPRKGEIWLGSLDQSASDEKDRGWRFKKMGVTVPDLVHASFHSLPVHFRQDPNPSRVFSGKIDTSLIAINLMTGKVVKFGDEAGSAATYLGEHSLVGSLEGQSEERDRLMDLLDELEGEEEEKGDVGELLYLTRTDYTLRIHHPPTPDSVTTLKYSTYSPPPSSLDPLLSSAIWGHGRTADGLYAMFAAGTQGALQAEKDGGVVLGFREVDQKKTAGAGTGGGLEGVWAVNMDSLPIAFYDILSITNIDAPPFILPQPIPSLSTLFSTPHGPPSRLPQILFIGQTTSHNTSSSLFALSRDNHPLIGYFQPLSSSARTSELEGYHVLDGVDLIDEELSLRMPSSSSSTEKGVKEGWKEKQERIGIEGPPEWAQSNGRDLVGERQRWWHSRWIGVLGTSAIGFLGWWWGRRSSSGRRNSNEKLTKEIGHASGRSSSSVKEQGPIVEKDEGKGGGERTNGGLEEAEPEHKKKKRRQRTRSRKKDIGGDEHEQEQETVQGQDQDTSRQEAKNEEEVDEVEEEEEAEEISGPVMIAESESKKTERELVVSDKLIGVGSHGTMVFEGTFQSRPVAVKRVLSHFTTLATQEINLLQSSDHHPNIIRYFYQETSDPWLFIALELCPASLEDLFTKHREVKELRDKLIPKDALRDIFGGVRHLHGLKIIHRDIKPPNILVSLTAKGLKMLISDFGLAKQTTLDQSSFGGTVLSSSITHLAPTGTTGWRAPEVLLHRGTESESSGDASSWDDWDVVRTGKGAATSAGLKQISKRLTSAVDVFSLGCLTYWLLTRGGHPFGERMERDRNICKGRSQLNGLPLSEEECSEARDLVSKMISQDSSNRPSVDEAFLHPYFWSPARKLSFLQDASDRFEIFVRDPPDPMLQLLENGSTKVIGSPRDWMRLMDQSFVDSLGKYRKYDVGSLRDLLRALRNKRHHYLDLPAAAREAMSPLPEGFLAYFTKRFPLLFLHVYGVISSTELRDEGGFREYFLDGER